MLFGIDTSGKIGEGNIFVSVVEHKHTEIIVELREKIKKRHMALASRRRIKASDLKNSELKWFIDNFKTKYSLYHLPINTFSTARKDFINVKNWRFKILACIFYLAAKDIVKDGVILIDRDYSEDVMRSLIKYMRLLFEYNNKNDIAVEVGSSFNEVIVMADMIAGYGRKNHTKCNEVKIAEIRQLMRILK